MIDVHAAAKRLGNAPTPLVRALLLSRDPDALLASANDDFKAALQRNRSLKLDPRAFSPKLVARFEQVRGSR